MASCTASRSGSGGGGRCSDMRKPNMSGDLRPPYVSDRAQPVGLMSSFCGGEQRRDDEGGMEEKVIKWD